MAALMTMIRTENFSNLVKSGDTDSSASPNIVAQSMASIQNIIHDADNAFKDTMQNFCMEVQGLRIERIEFADASLQKHVSDFAVSFTKLAAHKLRSLQNAKWSWLKLNEKLQNVRLRQMPRMIARSWWHSIKLKQIQLLPPMLLN